MGLCSQVRPLGQDELAWGEVRGGAPGRGGRQRESFLWGEQNLGEFGEPRGSRVASAPRAWARPPSSRAELAVQGPSGLVSALRREDR